MRFQSIHQNFLPTSSSAPQPTSVCSTAASICCWLGVNGMTTTVRAQNSSRAAISRAVLRAVAFRRARRAALPRVRHGLIEQFAVTFRLGLLAAAKQIGEVLPPQPASGSIRNHARRETTIDTDADLLPMIDATYEFAAFSRSSRAPTVVMRHRFAQC